MSHHIAAQQIEEDGWQWKSAKDAAARFVLLAERLPGAVQGLDPSRQAAPSATTSTSHVPASLLALDERRELRRIFEGARATLDAMHPEVAGKWWSCWWAVRVEGVSARDGGATGYGKTRAFEILREVDAYVILVMEERQAREGLGEEYEAALNATPPPRVRYAEAEVMPWEEE